MTFTGRIRLFLIFGALLPPVLILAVVYFYAIGQAAQYDLSHARNNLKRFESLQSSYMDGIDSASQRIIVDAGFRKSLSAIKGGRADRFNFDSHAYGLDFLEVIGPQGTVVASAHRPGLIGISMLRLDTLPDDFQKTLFEKVEYDFSGPHPANGIIKRLGNSYYFYTGQYIDDRVRERFAEILDADISLIMEDDPGFSDLRMNPGEVYRDGDNLKAIVAGGRRNIGFVLMANFKTGLQQPVFDTLLLAIIVVGSLSVLGAIVLGFYITGRAKKEIDNLVGASARIAGGDFVTPIIAFDEGEFTRLAEALNEMRARLNDLQKKLATAEKIAAWETVGRKIAHEIKNPLTPISIAVEDLHSAYIEKLPDFDTTLKETTGAIKSEVSRLTKLLDQFVSFARMSSPLKRNVKLTDIFDGVQMLYRREIDQNRLKIVPCGDSISANIDPELMKQVLINLIKNGLETSTAASVELSTSSESENLLFEVSDTGPGFSREKLIDSFQPYASTKQGGSGLGLVICHRIVHDHGGSMELLNRPEGGGLVRIRVPR